jgi:hypothetical protein
VAIIPNLSHPARAPAASEVEEAPDSKEFAISERADFLDRSCFPQRRNDWTLDARRSERITSRRTKIISIIVFDFGAIYAMVYIFQ